LTRAVTQNQFAAAIDAGNQGLPAELESLLHHMPVQQGDVVFVPAGTLHAINAGIMLFEIQQKSDLTYRVYDYGRRDPRTGLPRELHLEKALDVSILAPAERNTIPPLNLAPGGARRLLTACTYFALEHWNLDAAVDLAGNPATFEILTVLDGHAQLSWAGDSVRLQRGDSLVLPAELGACTLAPSAPLTILRAYVPDIQGELAPLLRNLGYSAAQIAATVDV
jgi:mannose-6-phosphate isomerase